MLARSRTGPPGDQGAVGGQGPRSFTYVSAAYYSALQSTDSAASNSAALTNGDCYFIPIIILSAVTAASLAIRLNTNGSLGSVARLGIFNDNGSGKPGTVLLDAGTVATNTGAGATPREIAISQALAASTWYWLACAQQGGAATGAVIRTINRIFTAMEWDSTVASTPPGGYKATGITGVFANNPTVTVLSTERPIATFWKAT